MAEITLRVLEGADRGHAYNFENAPITIGREEGNTIQLNDERVSRFHIKIQQDHSDLVLTDLESTNGTKVNNEEVQLRILRHGDMITVGRSTLIFGTRSEINQRFERLSAAHESEPNDNPSEQSSRVALKSNWKEDPNYQLALLDLDPPRLPERLSPGQAAQLSEVMEFLHMHLRRIVSEAEIKPRGQAVDLPTQQWQQLLDLQSRLAEYLKKIGNPSS